MNRVQTLRSSVAGNRPSGRSPGELFVNFPDNAFGVVNAAGTATDLLAVRIFSALATYAIGDFVLQTGNLWRAIAANGPAAFNAANWTQIATAALYLPLTGGTLSGKLLTPSTVGGDAAATVTTKDYVDAAIATSQALSRPGQVTLTDGATPALNAALGSHFVLTTTTNPVIGIPSSPLAGQKITIAVTASGGARTAGLNTGAGGFRFGSDVTALTPIVSGKTDYIGAIYNSGASFWDVVGYSKGF